MVLIITNKNTEKKKRGRPAKEGGKRWVELNPSPFVKKFNKKISKQNSGISVLAVSAALKETTNFAQRKKSTKASLALH